MDPQVLEFLQSLLDDSTYCAGLTRHNGCLDPDDPFVSELIVKASSLGTFVSVDFQYRHQVWITTSINSDDQKVFAVWSPNGDRLSVITSLENQ